MNEQIETRLRELKAEYQSGQKMMTDLKERQAALETTMLRISGAIQVLEELSASPKAKVNNSSVDATANQELEQLTTA